MTPLILITGFLGAGKTTLLRQLLVQLRAANIRAHVILNDYANAALDSATLRDLAPDIIPITGSRVCCNSLGNLLGELEGLPLVAGLLPVLGLNFLGDRSFERGACVAMMALAAFCLLNGCRRQPHCRGASAQPALRTRLRLWREQL
jgi:hypothetical protein